MGQNIWMIHLPGPSFFLSAALPSEPKLDIATSYVARLQHRTAICTIASITVTAAILWLKHRMKHISGRGPYFSSRKAANTASLLSPYKSCSSSTSEMTLQYLSLFSLWLGPLLGFYTVFLHQFSYFFSLNWTLMGHFFGSVVALCSPPLFTVWAWTYLTR